MDELKYVNFIAQCLTHENHTQSQLYTQLPCTYSWAEEQAGVEILPLQLAKSSALTLALRTKGHFLSNFFFFQNYCLVTTLHTWRAVSTSGGCPFPNHIRTPPGLVEPITTTRSGKSKLIDLDFQNLGSKSSCFSIILPHLCIFSNEGCLTVIQ